MRGRAISCLIALVALAGPLASAQERSAPAGAVVVRPVQVREVRVDQPTSRRLDDERPSLGIERPVDPGFISRPIPRPQHVVTSASRHSRRGRNRFYTFTPRYNIGYGVVVGYPVLYPYAYPFDPFSATPVVPYPYTAVPPAPNTYSNVASGTASGNVTPASPIPAAIACEASTPCGGLSFDITPESAQVYVDGVFAGSVDDFTATSAPLLLAPGAHYIEIRLAGYRTASVDVTIAAGEVTPYEGTLERLRLSTP